MTRKTNSNFPTIKKLLVFILATLMCLSLFMASACKNDDQANKIPEYSYTDNVVGELKNPSFTFGTQSLEYKNYPKTSVDGWSFTKVATSKSGVVDVSESGWTELMQNLYKDDGLLSYVKHINDFDNEDIREIIKNGDANKTVKTEEIKQFIIDNYFLKPETQHEGITGEVKYAFLNPGKHQEAVDNKVYMLNNYNKNFLTHGCVQTLTSSTDITLKRGEYAKVSVWVKTANLDTAHTSNNHGQAIGANISVKNTFNGSQQANYGIYNITNTEWAQYTFYIKADNVFETKFTLQLGLGYENYPVSGTVYFDDISVELLDAETFAKIDKNNTVTHNISYNNKDNTPQIVKASEYNGNNTLYLYDMNVNLTNYSSDLSFEETNNGDYYYFTNGSINSNDYSSVAKELVNDLDAPYGISNGLKVELKKPASYSIKLDDNGTPFKLPGESYSAITFFVKNNLNKLYSPNITINVQDIFGNVSEKRSAVATISEINDEWAKYTVIINNNFDEDAKDINGNEEYVREFYLEIVIGPDEEASAKAIDDYALGTVTFTSPIISTGKTYQYASEDNEIANIETENYQYYKLLSNTASGETALYAGFPEDYVEDETTTNTYSFAVAMSNIGKITHSPAAPKFYTGIESGHYYITGDKKDSVVVNNNSNAGLINSNYLEAYGTELQNALNHKGQDSIQPLMIKSSNKSYGFISENYTIPENSYAKVSVDVRVSGAENAKAYIYLVDTSKTEKHVLKLDKFTVNTAEGDFNNYGEVIEGKELCFDVSADMLDDNGWLTVEFYVATGATQKDFRIELWNGSRAASELADDEKGYVFFDNVIVSETNAFSEPPSLLEAFNDDNSPLLNQSGNFDAENLIAYERELTALEKQYISEGNKLPEGRIPAPKYVWAKTYKMIYAIYNTIDQIEVDPYASDVEDDEVKDEPLYQADPATFWLSLSSIILGVALIVAIIMLFIKNIRRRRRASRNDAKSHYTVRSRTKKPTTKTKVEEVDIDIDIDVEEPTTDDSADSEQSLDSYVYGDVQVFGDEDKTEEQKVEDVDQNKND